MIRITDAVKHLIIINIIMLIGTLTIGNGELFFKWFSIYFPYNNSFQFWQIFTHMFMHLNFEHLFFNMFLLVMVGVIMERSLGTKRFVFLYISAGLGAALISTIVDYMSFNLALSEFVENGFDRNQVISALKAGALNPALSEVVGEDVFTKLISIFYKLSVGASGAIMGILAAFGFMYPNMIVYLIFPPIPIKVKYLVVGVIGSDLISVFLTGTPLLGTSNTGYVAHVGGAAVGLLISWYWKKNQFDKYRWN